MAIAPILAMTAVEMRNISDFPGKIAWMACHFSPYGPGLSNLPKDLPHGSILILDDATPPHRHDPDYILQQLRCCAETHRCAGILLDFQRPGSAEAQAIAACLAEALPCPVIVSAEYARDLACPVILSPVPPSVPLEDHLASWQEREVWLELGLDGEILTLTESGCETTPLPHPDPGTQGFMDEELCCHYQIETNEKSARFTLWRTNEDIHKLLEKAAIGGITAAIGLYQELQ